MNRMLMNLLALVLFGLSQFASAAEASMDDAIADLSHGWAKAYYQVTEREKDAAFVTLTESARTMVKQFPGRAEPLIWQAIVLSSHAKFMGGLGALSKAKEARDLLLAAEKIDSRALNGSLYSTLGGLYAKVPGWPIGFGDKDKARACFEKALGLNARGIDANYFYGEFLADQGEYAKAAEHLGLAQSAAPRPGREDADTGRRKEIAVLLATVQDKLDKHASAR